MPEGTSSTQVSNTRIWLDAGRARRCMARQGTRRLRSHRATSAHRAGHAWQHRAAASHGSQTCQTRGKRPAGRSNENGRSIHDTIIRDESGDGSQATYIRGGPSGRESPVATFTCTSCDVVYHSSSSESCSFCNRRARCTSAGNAWGCWGSAAITRVHSSRTGQGSV